MGSWPGCCMWEAGPRPPYMGGHSEAWSMTSAAGRAGQRQLRGWARGCVPCLLSGLSPPCPSLPTSPSRGTIPFQTGSPHPTPPMPAASPRMPLPSAWGALWGVGSEGRRTSWAGVSWGRGKTEGMEPGTEAGKPGGRFWCRAGCPRPGETGCSGQMWGTGSRAAVWPGPRGSQASHTRMGHEPRPASPLQPPDTDRRNGPPSTRRGCGCGAARGGGRGGGGQPGPRPAGCSAGTSRRPA